MLISIHDSVHYNIVHLSGEVLIGRQLDISCCKSYAHDTLAGNSRWNPAPESASFRRELQQNLC